ncbi:MAG: aminoacyl-tRNA hydrolase [Methylotenera sp.]|nr:aminoacyl-tRNA hydrolase [Oligoflexia bacterium]
MKLVVGLGNPGPKYETTRHNVGFLAIDRLVERWRATGPVDRNQAEVYQAKVGSEQVLLIKPMTFMNLSGKSLGPLFTFYKCKPEDVIVIHDELDLLPITLRLKAGGGSGGHNGLKSIAEHIGTDNIGYYRVRLGVGHPRMFNMRMSPADYVLGQFTNDELKRLDPLLDQAAQAIEWVIDGNIRKAMNEFNRAEKPESV